MNNACRNGFILSLLGLPEMASQSLGSFAPLMLPTLLCTKDHVVEHI
jgi:hypothetical protein